MAIPDYQTVMLPLLTTMQDEQERSLKDCVQILAEYFKLTPEEQRELLPGGGQPTFHNRVGWARTYLKKAGLLESPKRSFIKISPRGMDVLKKNPKRIDVKYLAQFPEFIEFQGKKNDDAKEHSSSIAVPDKSPEELMRDAFQNLRRLLATELLDQIQKCSPAFFERLVVELLVKMGYGGSVPEVERALVTGRSGDEGIDGVIKEDKLGLSAVYVQAKRWKGTVGTPEIDRFVGALDDKGSKGVFITTSDFSKDAWERAKRIREPKRVVLVNGEMLASLMIQYNLGVSIKDTYEIKKVDFDYFSEEE